MCKKTRFGLEKKLQFKNRRNDLYLAVFLVSAVFLLNRTVQYREGRKEYRELRELQAGFFLELSERTKARSVSETPEWTAADVLAAQNPDYAFWLTIPGTEIDYPVVSCTIPGYYLNHTFSGKETPCGSIFFQEQEGAFPWDNLVLYGHNMKDGSMFADLKNYIDKEFYVNHPDIWIYRNEEWLHYAIYSCMIIKEDDKQYYEKQVREVADSIITLSTCYGSRKRVIVQAVLLCYTE